MGIDRFVAELKRNFELTTEMYSKCLDNPAVMPGRLCPAGVLLERVPPLQVIVFLRPPLPQEFRGHFRRGPSDPTAALLSLETLISFAEMSGN